MNNIIETLLIISSLTLGAFLGFDIAQNHLEPIIQAQLLHCQKQCDDFFKEKTEYLSCVEKCNQVAKREEK